MKTEDKDDNVKKIEIHHGDMEAQQFQIGDFVYIDEDGNMESVGTSWNICYRRTSDYAREGK